MSNNSTISNDTGRRRRSDGGLTALGGFAFQFIGMLARMLDSRVKRVMPFPISDEDAGFSLIGDATEEVERLFGVELFDEDGAELQIYPDGSCVLCLIQYKYSETPDSTKNIDKSHLKAILEKMEGRFEQAKEAMGRDDVKPCYILATNRAPGLEMQEILEAQEKEEVHAKVEEDADFKRRLEYFEWEKVDAGSCRRIIEEQAHAFGMLPQEIEEAIPRMVGSLFTNVLQGRPVVSSVEIIGKLVGFSAPRSLNSPEVRELMEQKLEDFYHEQRMQEPLGRRDALRNILEAVAQRSIVILYGQGGNGKSVLIHNFLMQQLDQGAFIAIDKASSEDITQHWLRDCVVMWRNGISDQCQTESATDALQRLVIARDQPQPILLLTLDALDESQPNGGKIRSLLRLFLEVERRRSKKQPPQATLLITCRTREDVLTYMMEPGHQGLDSGEIVPPDAFILIDEFSQQELEEILQQGDDETESIRRLISDLIRMTPKSIYSSRSSPTHVATLKAPVPSDGRVSSAVIEIIEAMRHPLVWGFFWHGTPLTHHDREQIITNADETAVGKLCESIVTWFDHKCRVRSAIPIQPLEARAILIEAARSMTDVESTGDSSDNWVRPAHQRYINPPTARLILTHAISSGLIDKVADGEYDFTWRWRHPFFARYLARQRA